MFESIKSVETLEKELRELVFNDFVGPVGDEAARQHVDFMEAEDVVLEVYKTFSSRVSDSEFNRISVGQQLGFKEIAELAKIQRLVKSFLKKKGWTVAEGWELRDRNGQILRGHGDETIR